jgi:hypothetical protein
VLLPWSSSPPHTPYDQADQEQIARKRAELLSELSRLDLLPPRSQYVLNRRRVISKALELLSKEERSGEEEDELAKLLGSLAL